MSAIFQAACNRVTYACGCASWLQMEGGQWVLRSSLCQHCEFAATGRAA